MDVLTQATEGDTRRRNQVFVLIALTIVLVIAAGVLWKGGATRGKAIDLGEQTDESALLNSQWNIEESPDNAEDTSAGQTPEEISPEPAPEDLNANQPAPEDRSAEQQTPEGLSTESQMPEEDTSEETAQSETPDTQVLEKTTLDAKEPATIGQLTDANVQTSGIASATGIASNGLGIASAAVSTAAVSGAAAKPNGHLGNDIGPGTIGDTLTVNAGKVGINNPTPSNALEVTGDIKNTGKVTTPQLCLSTDCRASWPASAAGGVAYPSVTEVTGKVGIGTANPTSKLEITDATGPNSLLVTNKGDIALKVQSGVSSPRVLIPSGFGNEPTLSFLTTPPQNTDTKTGLLSQCAGGCLLFMLNGAQKYEFSTDKMRMPPGSPTQPSLTDWNNANSGIYWPTPSGMGFVAGSQERMRVDGTGNVGIGTAAPTAKLDVAGDVKTTGVIFPDGSKQTTASAGSTTTKPVLDCKTVSVAYSGGYGSAMCPAGYTLTGMGTWGIAGYGGLTQPNGNGVQCYTPGGSGTCHAICCKIT